MAKRQRDIDAAQVERIINFLKSNGAGSHVRRADLKKVSCGMLNSGTMANADSNGTGPDERVVFGSIGKVSYPVESLARYMEERGFVIEMRSE